MTTAAEHLMSLDADGRPVVGSEWRMKRPYLGKVRYCQVISVYQSRYGSWLVYTRGERGSESRLRIFLRDYEPVAGRDGRSVELLPKVGT